MNYFVVEPNLLQRIATIVEFASRPENLFVPGEQLPLPGDVEGHILKSGTVQAVFSWAKVQGKVYRYLTICVVDGLPHERVAWTLAHLFGFRGATHNNDGFVESPSPDWVVDVDESLNMILILESLFDKNLN